jgi:acyl phosphate:glycerol-3-phosphate acyltransferase
MVGAIVIAYVLGSIPFSYLVVKSRTGQDVRRAGSGNVGTTNVLRVAGKAPALIALLGDFGKGIIAVLIARWLAGPAGAAAAAVAAVVGHVRPIFLRSGGGKGAATGLGVFSALAPPAALMCVAVLAVVIASTRYVSLGTMVATALAPVLIAVARQLGWLAPDGGRSLIAMTGIAILILIGHRGNLRRLRAGQEPKIGERWKADQNATTSLPS